MTNQAAVKTPKTPDQVENNGKPSFSSKPASIWEEHQRSYQPEVLYNEVSPKTVLPVLVGATSLILAMFFLPNLRRFTGLDHPVIPLAFLYAGGLTSILQWRLWKHQRLVQVLCLVDNCLYCLAIVAIMIDTISPIRYAWGLLYGQAAAYYGRRYAFSWPLLASISFIPFVTTLILAHDDFGLLSLTLFGALIFAVSSTTTRHSRRIERQKERYRNAYHLADKVASKSLDIAIATSMAEVGTFLHEFRNAVTPIAGNLLIIKQHVGLHPDIDESVEILERSYARTNALIEKLLASIKRRSIPKDTTFVLSDVIIPDCFTTERTRRNRAKIFLQGIVPRFEIRGDPEHLRAAIENLIQNAIDAGAYLINLSVSFDGGLKRVIVSISDDGPGIPEEFRDSLFQPDSKSRRSESHGLGLPLSKRLIEVLGGELRLAETSDTGTRFEIVIAGRLLL